MFAQIKIELLRKLPVPKADSSQQAPIVNLVGRVLAAKRRSAGADTKALEREINRHVYALFRLNEEEIALVQDSQPH